jgi:polyphenol oxidase
MKRSNPNKSAEYAQLESSQGMIYYSVPRFKELGAELAFSTRLRKVKKAWKENNMADPGLRADFLRSLGYDEHDLVTVKQVHGGKCIEIDETESIHGSREKSDGIISAAPGKIIAISTADCLAISMVAKENRVLALLHGGWRGLVDGIIRNAMEIMISKYRVQAGSLVVCLGPAIGACCYHVGPDLIDAFKHSHPYLRNVVSKNAAGQYCFDLRKAAAQILKHSGVNKNNIVSVDLCTSCNNEIFYSCRPPYGIPRLEKNSTA